MVVEELVSMTGQVTSMIAGSIRWQAPELIWNENEDDDDNVPSNRMTPASDVWAFGCTMYEVRLLPLPSLSPSPLLNDDLCYTHYSKLATGNLPYCHRRQDWSVILDIMNGIKPYSPESGPLTGMLDGLWELMDSCWSFRDEDRPRMVEVESKLEEL